VHIHIAITDKTMAMMNIYISAFNLVKKSAAETAAANQRFLSKQSG
jgi:hypothetical protein